MKIERKMTAIYLSADERKVLEALADNADQTMSAYVRSLIRKAAEQIRPKKPHRAAEVVIRA